MSEFFPELDAQWIDRDAQLVRHAAKQAMDAHLLEISGDPAGSRPEDHLGVRGTEICQDFLEAAEHLGWPNAERLSLQGRVFGWPVWRQPNHYPPHPLSLAVLHPYKWDDLGYRIGTSLLHPYDLRRQDPATGRHYRVELTTLGRHKPLVMLCRDGLLRCHRDPTVFRQSYGYGYGRLPDGSRIAIDGDDLAGTLAKYLLPMPA